jgi:hypothetical protein
MTQQIYMFCLGVKPLIVDMIKELIDSGMEPMDAVEEAMDVMVASVREEILDA